MSMFSVFFCVHVASMAWALLGLRNRCSMRQDESDDKSGKQILVTEVLLDTTYDVCLLPLSVYCEFV